MKKRIWTMAWAMLALLVSVAPASAQTLFSGHVETSEGTPVYGMLVLAFRADVSSTAIQAITDVNGDFNIWGSIDAGPYYVKVDAGFNLYQPHDTYARWRSEWYDDSFYSSSATTLVIPPVSDPYTNVNFTLESWAVIRGTVLDLYTGQPVSGITVRADNQTGSDIGSRRSQITGADGVYELYINEGSWSIFADTDGLPYASQYYDGQGSSGSADLLTVAVSEVRTNINFSLTPVITGTLSGRVTRPDGTPLAGATVRASGNSTRTVTTQADGTYAILNVQAGSFPYSLSINYAPYPLQYYCGQYDPDYAHGIVVTPGADIKGLDFHMWEPAQVSGVITGLDGAPLAGLEVRSSNGQSDYTGSDGSYTITGLPPGEYRINVLPQNASDDALKDYISEYYNDKPNQYAADYVTVAEGAVVTGIDFNLTLGGRISGTAQRESGTYNGQALIYPWPVGGAVDHGRPSTYASYNEPHAFTIRALPPGDYQVQGAEFSSYVCDWYSNKFVRAEADVVTVTGTNEVTGIDIRVYNKAYVRGRITTTSSTGLSGVYVYALTPEGELVGHTDSDGSGNYEFDELSPGTYVLWAAPMWRNADFLTSYAARYYGGASLLSGATPVTVVEGETQTGRNIALPTVNGRISGRVTVGGAGWPGTYVYVQQVEAPDDRLAAAETDSNGYYTIRGLNPGNYHVWSGEPDSNIVKQWYNGQSDLANATTVTVASSEVSGINFALEETPDLNSTPGIIHPVCTSDEAPPVFQWNTRHDGPLYELRVDDGTAGTTGVISVAGITGQCYTSTVALIVGHDYTSRVRGGNTGGYGYWSPPVPFTYLGPPQFLLDVQVDGPGHVDLDPPGGSYEADTVVELTAVEVDGSSFDHWDGVDVGTIQPMATVTVRTDRVVVAWFVANHPPAVPVIIAPANGATEFPPTGDLTAGAFSDPDAGHVQGGSHAQVLLGAVTVFEQINTNTPPFQTFSLFGAGLEGHTNYAWRVRYADQFGLWSDWSSWASFATANQPPIAPLCLAPSNTATGISIQPWLHAGPFSDPDSPDTHAASHWQVAKEATGFGSPVFSFEGPPAVEQQVPLGSLTYTSYVWRVRYSDSQGDWSDWSNEAQFTSTLTLDGVAPDPVAGMIISWPSLTGYQYSLYRTYDLATTGWSPVDDYQNLPGTGVVMSYHQPPGTTEQAYYKLVMVKTE